MSQRRLQARNIQDSATRVKKRFEGAIHQVIKDALTKRRDIEHPKIFAYLCSRLLADGQWFRDNFLKTINFYFTERINDFLPEEHKLNDNLVLFKGFINYVLRSIYERSIDDVNKQHLFGNDEFWKLVNRYKKFNDSDYVDEIYDFLLDNMVEYMEKLFNIEYNAQPDDDSKKQFVEAFHEFFYPEGERRAPSYPKHKWGDMDGSRSTFCDNLGYIFSITRPDAAILYSSVSEHGVASASSAAMPPNQSGKEVRPYVTTVLMSHGGVGSARHFNPKNSQATQALGAWQVDGKPFRFIHATMSVGGRHAEEQLITAFKYELQENNELLEARRDGKKVTVHLFISKSPCQQKCIEMLKNFLVENGGVKIHFYLQQWYESNVPSKLAANAEAFFSTMQGFMQSGQVTYSYLPLATHAVTLLNRHKQMIQDSRPTDSPFYPMPDNMVKVLYHRHTKKVERFTDNAELDEHRRKLWRSGLPAAAVSDDDKSDSDVVVDDQDVQGMPFIPSSVSRTQECMAGVQGVQGSSGAQGAQGADVANALATQGLWAVPGPQRPGAQTVEPMDEDHAQGTDIASPLANQRLSAALRQRQPDLQPVQPAEPMDEDDGQHSYSHNFSQ